MSRVKFLATSAMRIDVETDRKAFVTVRFAGDELSPDEISGSCLSNRHAAPQRRKIFARPRCGSRRDRTGIWFLATDSLVPSDDPAVSATTASPGVMR
jgi:hypothetical protein